MTAAIEKMIESARSFSSDVALKASYEKAGYVSVRNCIPLVSLSNLQADLNAFFLSSAPGMGADFDESCVNLDKKNKQMLYELYKAGSHIVAFKEISRHLAAVVQKINGCNHPVMEVNIAFLIGLPKDRRLIYDFHQESAYDSADLKRFDNIINVHYPIYRSSSLTNGTMSALVSSHRYGSLTGTVKRYAENSLSSLVPNNIDQLVIVHPEVHFELELGDCLFFHKDLVHKSNFNSSDLCRAIGTSRLFQTVPENF